MCFNSIENKLKREIQCEGEQAECKDFSRFSSQTHTTPFAIPFFTMGELWARNNPFNPCLVVANKL